MSPCFSLPFKELVKSFYPSCLHASLFHVKYLLGHSHDPNLIYPGTADLHVKKEDSHRLEHILR